MMIFIMKSGSYDEEYLNAPRIAIPLDKVYSIEQRSGKIEITAASGEMDTLEGVNNCVAVPVMHTYLIEYSNAVAAAREMACFYYAVQNGKTAFLFSNQPELFDIDN